MILLLGPCRLVTKPLSPAAIRGGQKIDLHRIDRWLENRSSSDLSDFHISRLENLQGAQIDAPFVHMASRLGGIELDNYYAITIYGILIIQSSLPELREEKASGGDRKSINACLSHWNRRKWHGSSKIEEEETVEGDSSIYTIVGPFCVKEGQKCDWRHEGT
ncbi:hypothetical protein JCGZ_23636 [Jatropha curcas]|uniref:Uncharacterized protein n=1 Tax=Jatropha curcas TaxID=180498 RepID=A0A067L2K8_JATCU|nr:hypothetical protein JCGZ_23636 [Jatropha curcas]